MGKLNFVKKTKPAKSNNHKRWKILIVDDEIEVHNITKSVLKDFVFEEASLEFLSAYSAKEAISYLKKHDDIAVVLLDVVMETNDAGFVVVKKIRDELNNKLVRIILRTGEPGIAPARDIIYNYDINDYKEKTELTASKLYITILTALKSRKDILTIIKDKEQLLKQSKFVAMGEMMDAVAHQWKQPLSAIKISMEGLEIKEQMGILDPKDVKKSIDITKRQIDHLIVTIDDFRKMLKNEVKIEHIKLKDIIDNTLVLLKDSIMKYNIKFDIQGDENIFVDIMPTEFKHILINIINNAKDQFLKENIQNRQISIKYFENDLNVVINIEDNGGGIPESIIDKLFDVNFTTKKDTGGSGMGLYMTKLFCDKMDISISASNTENGACFTIQIPKKD